MTELKWKDFQGLNEMEWYAVMRCYVEWNGMRWDDGLRCKKYEIRLNSIMGYDGME